MSSGSFKLASYQANSGEVHPIRVQPETILGGNDEGGGITNSTRFRRGGSRRRYGNFARFITVGRAVGVAGAGTTGYAVSTVYAKVTIFIQDKWDLLNVGEAYTYAGFADWKICSKTPERVS